MTGYLSNARPGTIGNLPADAVLIAVVGIVVCRSTSAHAAATAIMGTTRKRMRSGRAAERRQREVVVGSPRLTQARRLAREIDTSWLDERDADEFVDRIVAAIVLGMEADEVFEAWLGSQEASGRP